MSLNPESNSTFLPISTGDIVSVSEEKGGSIFSIPPYPSEEAEFSAAEPVNYEEHLLRKYAIQTFEIIDGLDDETHRIFSPDIKIDLYNKDSYWILRFSRQKHGKHFKLYFDQLSSYPHLFLPFEGVLPEKRGTDIMKSKLYYLVFKGAGYRFINPFNSLKKSKYTDNDNLIISTTNNYKKSHSLYTPIKLVFAPLEGNMLLIPFLYTVIYDGLRKIVMIREIVNNEANKYAGLETRMFLNNEYLAPQTTLRDDFISDQFYIINHYKTMQTYWKFGIRRNIKTYTELVKNTEPFSDKEIEAIFIPESNDDDDDHDSDA